MAKSLAEELGARLSNIESRLNALSGNRLDHASLDGSTLYLKDSDGNLQGRLGRQPDGSNGVHVVRVQPPPQLTAAILTVGEQAGTCLVEWDGRTFDGRRMPLIHGHTEVWAELVGEDWSPTVAPGDAAKRVGTIRDRTGGEVVVALPQAGTWAVWLRAMGADRETAGPWSPVATVEITPLVDTEAIQEELDQAQQRIDEADQRLTEGQGELDSKLGELDERVGPGVDGTSSLTQALTTGLDDVYREAQQYAESQADDAVNQAAANAQSEYDRLQEIAERALSRAGDNVLEDPSFETDYWFNNWPSTWFPAAPTAVSRTGDQAAAITRAQSTLATTFNLGTVDVEPDDSWRFSLWYRVAEDDHANLNYGVGTKIRIRDAADNTILEESSTFMVSEEWNRAVLTLTVPDGVGALHASLTPSHTEGTLIIDDIAFQEVGAAAEALRLAEVARQQAEAAHVAAGNAVDAAAGAYDAASSKSTVHWSLSAPSGTADSSDDVWWQYKLRNGKRVVIGQWFWDSGVWRETEIAEEFIPLINFGTGTYGDLTGDRLAANTVQTNHLLVGPQNLITDPGFEHFGEGSTSDGWDSYTGGWERQTVSWADRDFAQIIRDETDDTGRKDLHYGGSGAAYASIPCVPGEVYKARFQVLRWAGSQSDEDWRAQFRWADANGGGVGWTTSNFAAVGNQGWHEFEATAPEGAAFFYFRFSKFGAVGGSRGVSNVSLEKMADSSLIVRGAVKSHSVDTEEFFAAEAVIQKVWTEIVRSRLIESQGIITEDMIATGAITTPKLTVTEEMVGEVAKLIRIEAGSLASNEIYGMIIQAAEIIGSVFRSEDAAGEETVRLDGVDNFLAGRLRAGRDSGESIALDYGTKIRRSGLNEEGEPVNVRTIHTPYLNFYTNRTYQEDQEPAIYIDEGSHDGDGQMIINPGYKQDTPIYRGRLNVVGDVLANRLTPRERIQISTSHDDQPGVIQAVGQGVRIRGQVPALSHSQEMFYVGQTDMASLAPGGLRRRFINWGVPVPRGRRDPIVTAYLQGASSDNRAYITVNVSNRFQSYYALDEYNTSSATANYWVGIIAPWRDA